MTSTSSSGVSRTPFVSDADVSVGAFEPGTDRPGRDGRHAAAFPSDPSRPSVVRVSSRWPVAAAAAVIAVIVVGGAFFLMQRRQPAVVALPTPTPSAEPSPSLRGVVPPSSTPERERIGSTIGGTDVVPCPESGRRLDRDRVDGHASL